MYEEETGMIDPKNPFRNETEFREYNSDYGEIVPQIRIEGCQIPLFPNVRERQNIRKYENIVGGFLLMHFILMNLLAFFLMEGYILLQRMIDTIASGGELPVNYDKLVMDYFENTSSYMVITMLAGMQSYKNTNFNAVSNKEFYTWACFAVYCHCFVDSDSNRVFVCMDYRFIRRRGRECLSTRSESFTRY